MKLSTKGRYGLKAMFVLALEQDKGPIPLKLIANRQNISMQYLEQIFSALKKANLVKSVRGAQGGYLLAKNAKDITVGDVLNVLEGPVSISECMLDEDICENSNTCVTKGVWEKIKKGIEDVTYSITLQDMIDDNLKNMQEKI
ncbi:RrF2 family transcriptional regulator [Metaclostridioides mangenotii]|jgi:Rrf2 family cysteine metabolism transcriptional repressor|uniref:Rrf2 family protein n=1 Tax=Metaclostridioides mangenotii TaxID=1540 RepID=A0ABS4E9A4_9FIRM|nr:Rrf2 family transcriptional regulator [Clostridioides mangenotii]MBP1854525.1 Rrf2 family protein [Clostridioides mangenotii]